MMAEVRRCWTGLLDEIRQERADLRKMKRIITGVENPSRRLWRRARRDLMAETEELNTIGQRVVAGHRQEHERG